MVILDTTIVNVALPSIAKGLNTNISGIQWVVAGYTISFASLLLLAGNLTDRFGAKYILTIGLFGFLITSLACGLSPDILVLSIFRMLQGITATFLIPASLSIISLTFTERKEFARAIGIWGGIGGIAAASGPVLGSILTAAFSWRAVFLVNVPIALLAILLLYYAVNPTKQEIEKKANDWLGQSFAILFTVSLAITLIEVGKYGWTSPFIIYALVFTFVSFTLFIATEKHAKYPMLPLNFFKSSAFSCSIATGFIINCGAYGQLFLLPLYFSKVKQYSVTKIGFAVLPFLILAAIAAYFSGKMIARTGPRRSVLLGLMIGTIGFLSLGIAIKGNFTYYWLITPLAAIGFGAAFTMPAATYIAMHAVSEKYVGVASSAFTTARQMGSLVGVAVFGSIAASNASYVIGMQTTLIIAAGIYLAGFIINFKITDKLNNYLTMPH